VGGMKDLFGDTPYAAPQPIAKQARDAAVKKVSDNSGDWISHGLALLGRLPRGYVGIGEEIRLRLTEMGLAAPHHHNAWGALILHGVKRGILRGTGRIGHMKMEKSHARKSEIYERV
jgi:hypothetical protein